MTEIRIFVDIDQEPSNANWVTFQRLGHLFADNVVTPLSARDKTHNLFGFRRRSGSGVLTFTINNERTPFKLLKAN